MASKQITMSAIGHVTAGSGTFTLEIDAPYRAALKGLEGFSHLNVLWWCHHLDTPALRRLVSCEKPYAQAPAALGTFATRSPRRPNPLALTAVQVLALDAAMGTIRVAFIDAEDGTPIVDIKPYHPCLDRIRTVSVPEWCAHWPEWYEDAARFDWEAELVNAR